MSHRTLRRRVVIGLGLVVIGIAVAIICRGWAQAGHQRRSPPPRTALSFRRHLAKPHAAEMQQLSAEDSVSNHVLASGSVESVAGVRIGGASVCLASTALRGRQPQCTRTDESGVFALAFSGDAPLELSASARGYEPATRAIQENDRVNVRFTLRPGGVLVSGSVVDAAGGPVPAAVVRGGLPAGSTLGLSVADDEGAFELIVPTGIVWVAASADGYSDRVRELQSPLDGVRLVLSPAATLVGQVLSEDTLEPISDLRVELMGDAEGRASAKSVRSAENGSFEFANVAAGRYLLHARSGEWRSEYHHVSVAIARRVDGVELLVRRAAQIAGAIRVEAGACERGEVEVVGQVREVAKSDRKGNVQIDGIPPGRYELEVSCEGARDHIETIELGLTGVDRVWNLDPGLRVDGVARSASGRPIAAAKIFAQRISGEGIRDIVVCTADHDGRFTCGGLSSGTYEFQLGASPHPRGDSVRVAVVEGAAAPHVSLRAYPAAAIRVNLRDADRYELPTLVFMARRGSDEPHLGELRGDSVFFEGLPLGSYDVWYEVTPAASGRRLTLTRDGEVADLDLELPPSRALSGRVVDSGGAAIPDAWVSARADSTYAYTQPGSAVLTDGEGSFSLVGLLPGKYQLIASSDDGEARSSVLDSGTSNVVLVLARHGSLSGSVVDSSGLPVPEFRVGYTARESGIRVDLAGARGHWSIPWLAPGSYDLQFAAPEGTASLAVDLSPGVDVSMHTSLEASFPGN